MIINLNLFLRMIIIISFFTDKKLDEVIQKIDQLAYNMREKKENTAIIIKKSVIGLKHRIFCTCIV